MIVTVAALADFASVSIGDKLNVMGVFDRVWAKSAPATHPRAVLVLRTLVEHEDREQSYRLRIRLEDEDGQIVFEGHGDMTVGTIPPGQTATATLILEIQNLPLPKFGRYSCVVTVGARELIRIPLTLAQTPTAPPVQ